MRDRREKYVSFALIFLSVYMFCFEMEKGTIKCPISINLIGKKHRFEIMESAHVLFITNTHPARLIIERIDLLWVNNSFDVDEKELAMNSRRVEKVQKYQFEAIKQI